MSKKWLCGVVVMMVLGGCKSGKTYGTACVNNDECESNICQGGPLGRAPKTCRCASNSDCPTGLVCMKTVDTGPMCEGPAVDAGIDAL